jgi:hypothetical protein
MSNEAFVIVAREDANKFYTLRLIRKSLLALSFLLLLSSGAFAQSRNPVQANEPKTMLTGVVYDINGAVVVDTLIVALDKEGKKYRTATDSEGVYKIELPLTLYVVQVSAPGFCPTQADDLRIVNSTHGKMSLDFVLEVAESPERCKHQFTFETKPKRKLKKRPNLIAE